MASVPTVAAASPPLTSGEWGEGPAGGGRRICHLDSALSKIPRGKVIETSQ